MFFDATLRINSEDYSHLNSLRRQVYDVVDKVQGRIANYRQPDAQLFVVRNRC